MAYISYSVSEDGVYCALFIAFRNQSDTILNLEFVQVSFCDWQNAMGVKRRLEIHAQSERHLLEALEMYVCSLCFVLFIFIDLYFVAYLHAIVFISLYMLAY